MTSGKASRDDREAKAAERRAAVAKKEARRRNGIITAVVAVVVLVVVGAYVLVQNDNSSQTSSSSASPKATTGKQNQSILLGSASATVVVDAYEDFQCPICKQFEEQSGPLLKQYLDQKLIKINYRPIAILDNASTTQYSTRALNSAGCVVNTSLDAFPKYHALLFANQPPENSAGLPDSKLIELAKQAGATDVSTCINDQTFKGWTQRVTEQASKDKVVGTPTILVNGTVVQDWQPANLKTVIDAALKNG
ncbi:DsbA family protein [Angustibacter luteus]|uniref:DsbA family protein n=1 Tax=Angustibacter luteus TaxID=658456 RepID=A0ABW1JBM3_9ACTN